MLNISDVISRKKLTAVFQPIIDLTSPGLTAYEALIRGPLHSNLHSPKTLFEQARQSNLTEQLELLCIEIACEAFFSKQVDAKLFVNMSSMSLINSRARKFLTDYLENQLGVDKDRVVIELSEQYQINDYDQIREALSFLREIGYQVAIDDLGAGYSSLRVWSEFKPEYVKIDRHFISDINNNHINHEFVRSIQEISRSVGCKVIAEGIETEAELKTVSSMGITHGQGYLLGKPSAKIDDDPVKNIIDKVNPLKQFEFYRHKDSVVNLMYFQEGISFDMTLAKTAEYIEANQNINSIPVLKDDIPLGTITRQRIMEVFFSRYGRELHSRKRIVNFIETNVLVVEQNTTLPVVSRLFTSGKDLDMNNDIIITNKGKYVGILKPKKLLEKITEQQIMSARYSNPLTLLPGNVPIYEWIDELLDRKQDFWLAYFDLNNFKPYNDIYGYSKGDKVINLLAEIIKNSVDSDADRVGHIGGDDFVVIFSDDSWREKCEQILARFREEIKAFYTEEDLKNDGIYCDDRRGNRQFFAILSIAIGLVNPDHNLCSSHHDVAMLATDAKHQAKKIGGNILFESRRRGNDQSFFASEQISQHEQCDESGQENITFPEASSPAVLHNR